jgi:VWFA-related protein
VIRVYVSVTDDKGNPIPDDQPVDLFLYEDGKEVSHQVLSTGWAVTSVLVLDQSGSMNDPSKIEKAKEAAIRYITAASPQHTVALVVFDDYARIVSKIGTDRSVVTSQVQKVKAHGGTALQDGIGLALDMLRGREGRRLVVALTDGIENSSKKFVGEAGLARLIKTANADGTSVYIVGLGGDVNEAYLRQLEQTGGKYFFSPTPNQLRGIFERTIQLLDKESVIQYTTESADRDGTTRKISVSLKVKDQVTVQQGSYTKTGVIPHVRGDHLPYVLLCLFLLILPGAITVTVEAISIIQFRLSSVERLTETSEAIKKDLRDRNVPDDDEFRFVPGDLMVKCPKGCPRVYHVGSWRFTDCRCICGGAGRYCFVGLFPDWLRKALDFISGRYKSKTGRTFLCRCAGDADGY